MGSSARTTSNHFIGEDGAPLSVYGMSTLDRSIKQVRAGSVCRITFLGKQKTRDGKRDFNAVRVEVKRTGEAAAFVRL